MRVAIALLAALLLLTACGPRVAYPPAEAASPEATMADDEETRADAIRLRLKGDRSRRRHGGR